jgi:hypothetical protein
VKPRTPHPACVIGVSLLLRRMPRVTGWVFSPKASLAAVAGPAAGMVAVVMPSTAVLVAVAGPAAAAGMVAVAMPGTAVVVAAAVVDATKIVV